MILIRNKLEIYIDSKKDTKDKRRKVAFAVFSYINKDNNNEHRISFTAKVNTPETEFWNIAPKSIEQ